MKQEAQIADQHRGVKLTKKYLLPEEEDEEEMFDATHVESGDICHGIVLIKKLVNHRNANVAEAKPEPPRVMEKEEPLEEGESLLLKGIWLEQRRRLENQHGGKICLELLVNQKVSVVK